MARQKKPGIDYFPLDVSFMMDIDIRVIRNRCGNDGPMVYLYLISKAYETNGYYIDYSDDLISIISIDMQIDEEKVVKIIDLLVSRKLLVFRAHEGIRCLTSPGIQKRFAQVCNYRARKTGINEDVWMIESLSNSNVGEMLDNCCSNVGEMLDNCCSNVGEMLPDGTERKEEKRKGEESKEKESKVKYSKEKEKKNEISSLSLSSWINEFGREWVDEAMKEAESRGHSGEGSYIRAILNNWKKERTTGGSYNVSDLYGGVT